MWYSSNADPQPKPAVGDEAAEGACDAPGSGSEFRQLLLADVEALLQQHHARFTEHLDQVAAKQNDILRRLSDEGKAEKAARWQPSVGSSRSRQSTRSGLGTIGEYNANTMRRPEFQIDGKEPRALHGATGVAEENGGSEDYHIVRSYSDSMKMRKTMAREASVMRPVSKKRSEMKTRPFLERLVTDKRFEAFFCFLIISNAFFIGIEVQYMASFQLQGPVALFEAVSIIYTVIFTVELVLRFFAAPSGFFCSGMYLWNSLDTLVVVVSLVEVVLAAATGFDSAGAQQLTYVRIIRVARTVRIFRVMRALKEFSSLRILLWCVVSTMRSLVWTLLLLAVIMYIFGIMFTQAANSYLIEHPDDHFVQNYWGSLWRSGYTLFKSVTGGVSWDEVSGPLGRVHPAMEVTFLVYISFTYFAVLNVVTGVFCQSAIESANHDKDMVVSQQMANKQMYKEQLEDVFKSIDQDDSGSVTFDMFEEALLNENNQLNAYLDSLGITPDDAWNLFRLMDTDESDDIEMEEFVAACLRLRGSARAVDSHMLMYESRWTMRKMTDLHRIMNDILMSLSSFGGRPDRIRPSARPSQFARQSLAAARQSYKSDPLRMSSSSAWYEESGQRQSTCSGPGVGAYGSVVEATESFQIGSGRMKNTPSSSSDTLDQHHSEMGNPGPDQEQQQGEDPAASKHLDEFASSPEFHDI